jgi:hypothetical protein
MQHAIKRNEQSCSNYAMCAVNLGRIGKMFNDTVSETVS